jgi:hypothetical protein
LRPQRAGAWAASFGAGLGGDKYPTPIPLEEPSQRPFQTVIPLSRRLGFTPIVDYQVGQERELASAVVSSSGVVLVSWEHKAITGGFFQRLPLVSKSKACPANGMRPDMIGCSASIDYLLRLLGYSGSSVHACYLVIRQPLWSDLPVLSSTFAKAYRSLRNVASFLKSAHDKSNDPF